MFEELKTYDEFLSFIEKETAVLTYFSTEACRVCKVLKPKIEALVQSEFPNIKLLYIQSDKQPEIAAQNRVFAAPTILVFFDGNEHIRKSRNIGISELRMELERPYSMLF